MTKKKGNRNPYATNRAGMVKAQNTPDTEKVKSSQISGNGDLRTKKTDK